jgi:prevent-host-death family protein
MKTVSIGEAEKRFTTYLQECEESPVVLTKDGKPIAVLLSVIEGEDIESLALAFNPRFRRMLDTAAQRIQQTGGIEHEEFWRSFEQNTDAADDQDM